MDDDDRKARRTIIGGRHGSPTVTIAWPFSQVTNTDTELRQVVADLATLVSRIASASGDEAELGLIRGAAAELAARCSSPD